MAFIIFRHIKKTLFDPVSDISAVSLRGRLGSSERGRAPRPIRRAGRLAQPIVIPAQALRQPVNSLENSLPSGIELNLSRNSASIELSVQPDPANYWNVGEDTRSFWGYP